MGIRRALAMIVGVVQITMAVLAVIFACIIYFNLFGFQTGLNIVVESCYFHVLVLFVFSLFSIISGLFLVHEWLVAR